MFLWHVAKKVKFECDRYVPIGEGCGAINSESIGALCLTHRSNPYFYPILLPHTVGLYPICYAVLQ